MKLEKFNFENMVTLSGDQVMTTSLKVAEYFGRRHKDVLRAIRKLDCSDEFTERNFALCHEINHLQNNKPQPFYKMTKDGFIFLVMGFTGKTASFIKENYINAFNWMAEQLYKMQANYMKQHNDWLLMSKHSKLKGSIGSGLMHERKREKKIIESEYQRLIENSQIKMVLM